MNIHTFFRGRTKARECENAREKESIRDQPKRELKSVQWCRLSRWIVFPFYTHDKTRENNGESETSVPRIISWQNTGLTVLTSIIFTKIFTQCIQNVFPVLVSMPLDLPRFRGKKWKRKMDIKIEIRSMKKVNNDRAVFSCTVDSRCWLDDVSAEADKIKERLPGMCQFIEESRAG